MVLRLFCDSLICAQKPKSAAKEMLDMPKSLTMVHSGPTQFNISID